MSHTIIPFTLLLLRNQVGSILLLQRAKTGFADGLYSLPGGKPEDNEPFRNTLVREAFEEIGITIRPEDATLVHTYHQKRAGLQLIALVFEVTKWEGEPYNKECEKHQGFAWFDEDNLPEVIIADNREILMLIRNKEIYSEHGW